MDSTLFTAPRGEYSDPTTVLPDELVVAVFRELGFAGRLAASHVCASWRRIALSDRRLWAQYRVDRRMHSKAVTLAALLERSYPLPFCLISEPIVPIAIADLVIDNMARMEKLDLGDFETDDQLQRILAQEIPALKRLSTTHKLYDDTPMLISPRWASASNLESLRVTCRCVWPPDCVFPSVRHYSGRVPEGPQLDAPLSQMLPNLSYLSLRHVTPALLHRLTLLPPSLTTLKLQTPDFGIGIDCTALLRRHPAPVLHDLTIYCTHTASCVIEAVRLFEHCVAGPWKLCMNGVFIGIRAPQSDSASHRYSVHCADQSLPTRISEIVPFCGRLCQLEIYLPDLLPFCAAHAVFPALASVSVSLRDEQNTSIANSLRDMPGIQAPVLQSLTLCPSPRSEKPLGGLLDRILHAFHSPRLASIFVDTDRPDAFEHDEIATLLVHAARFEIRTCAGDAVYVFS